MARALLAVSLLIASLLFYNIYNVTGSLVNVEGALYVGLAGLFLGYFYTASPLRLVARRGLGELAIFLAFGPLLTLGTGFAISSQTIEFFSTEFYMLLLLGIPFGLLTTNILFINQFPDAKSDAETGKNHLVVTLGKKAARWGYLVILTLAFYSSVYLNDFLNVHQNFSSDVFLVGNAVLYLFGLSVFSKLYKNYEKRELVNANIQTIVLQTLFSIFYIISLNLFFVWWYMSERRQSVITRNNSGSEVDSDINSTGEKQSLSFFNFYKDYPFDKIYISNLRRTYQTVRHFIDLGISYQKLKEFNEISWGVNQGKSDDLKDYAELTQSWKKGDLDNKFMDGESPNEMSNRIILGFNKVINDEQDNVLLCIHGRALRVLLSKIIDDDLTKMDKYIHSNTGLYIIDYKDGKFKILEKNLRNHLDK